MSKAHLNLIKVCTILCISLFSHFIIAQSCADPNGIILVSNTNDEGAGSLREAIDCANTSPGSNLIRFSIPGQGAQIIYVGSTSGLPLPSLIEPATVIDGRTQPGYISEPLIVLDGGNNSWGNPINAIWIRDNFCEVYGMEIRNFPDDGIDLRTADFTIVKDNYIHDNGYVQDYFPNVPGTGPWEGCGIVVREGSDQNIIAGNVIENNEYCGILFRDNADNNLVGGGNVEDANTISHNAGGILVNENSSGIQIQQNSIFCNDTIGIKLVGNANNNQLPPSLDEVSSNQISGTGDDGEVIEIFISNNSLCAGSICQGGLWIGSTVVVNGEWSFDPTSQSGIPIFGGYIITATARDALGNTSEFTSCEVVIGVSGCTDQNGNILVTNTQDEGPGSLRAAILCANSTLGANTIRFEIPGNMIHTIFVGGSSSEALPALVDPATIIDGTTQPGFGMDGKNNPRIILDGSLTDWTAPINAIWIRGDYCEVYGLEIRNFPDDGIDITIADYVKVGAINKGNVLYNNGDEIDFWPDAPPGTGPWNGCGIVMKQGSNFCEIVGNYIGTDYFQTVESGNEFCGVVIQNGGDNHLISSNVIAHHNTGVRINSGGIRNTLSQNSLYCNDSIPLDFLGNANLNYAAPIIDSVSNFYISGFADSLDVVEVFINVDTSCIGAPCQGSVYLGTTIVQDSFWSIAPPFVNNVEISPGDLITTTATDVFGNTSVYSTCVEATIICTVEVSVSEVVPTSCGESNGAFTANIINGRPPFTLDIGQGPTTDTIFNNLPGGNYILTVTDENNCTATALINIAPSSGPNIIPVNIMNASCNLDNGSFGISVTSGTAPYTYDIGNGPQGNPFFDNLPSGNYLVTVTDANECTSTESITLLQTGIPQASIINLENTSCGLANGSVTVEVTNGAPPFTYNIGNGAQTSPSFSDLSAGTYVVTVTDASSCTNTITTTINASTNPVATISNLVNASCNEDNGSFSVDVTLGTAPYLYDIGNGAQGSNSFDNLSAGFYTVIVTDNSGCTTSILAEITQSGILSLSIEELTNETCEASNGMFTIGVTGGIPPYTYDIGNGPQNNGLFTNLSAGTYAVVVSDVTGCTISISVTLSGTSIPIASISNLNNASCDFSNGSFSVNASSGTAPYTFDIGNGAQNANVFENLSGGNYEVTVTDNSSCTTTVSTTINQSGRPDISIVNLMNESCLQANGSVTILATGGQAPYNYNIGNGPQSSPDFTSLSAGIYTATVTDATACTVTTMFEIINDGSLPIASYSYVELDGTVTFTNTSQLGDAFLWDLGDGNTTNVVSPVHTYTESGDYEACLTVTNSCGTDTYCEIISIFIPLSQISLGGTIAKENGQTVALVDVSCSNNPSETTLIDGVYLYEDQSPGQDFLITPFKDINYINGCSTFDIFLINQHILEVAILDSPYKIIAADIDNNGNVTTLDLIRLQQLILFNVDTFPNNTSWRFVPEDYVFLDPLNPLDEDFPEEIMLDNVNADELENDFVAIKVGDMNLNSNPAAIIDPNGETGFNVDKVSQENGVLVLNMKPDKILTVSAFELSIQLDPLALEFMEVTSTSGNVPQVYYQKSKGILNLSWYDGQGEGIESRDLSFQLKLKSKTKKWQNAIQLSDQISPRVFDDLGNDTNIRLYFENEKSMSVEAVPNPFESLTQLHFYMESAQTIPIRVYGVDGHSIMDQEFHFEKGEQQIEIDLSGTPAGVYFYEVGFEHGVLVKN